MFKKAFTLSIFTALMLHSTAAMCDTNTVPDTNQTAEPSSSFDLKTPYGIEQKPNQPMLPLKQEMANQAKAIEILTSHLTRKDEAIKEWRKNLISHLEDNKHMNFGFQFHIAVCGYLLGMGTMEKKHLTPSLTTPAATTSEQTIRQILKTNLKFTKLSALQGLGAGMLGAIFLLQSPDTMQRIFDIQDWVMEKKFEIKNWIKS